MTGRRVMATGLGVVSCLGRDLDEHWRRLVRGDTGVGVLDGTLAAAMPVKLHAPVTGLRVEDHIHTRVLRKLLLPSAAFAVVAAGHALADAGIAGDDTRLDGCGVYFGSTSYEVSGRTFEPALRASFGADRAFDFSRFASVGMEQVDPLLIVKGLPNAAPCGVAIEHRLHGPNANYADGQTSGLQAAAAGFEAIRHGIADVAVVGGSDSLLLDEHVVGHYVAGRLLLGDDGSRVGARPFDARRCGYVLGEGAAVCVFEADDHARARGARVYGEILGAGETCAPDGDADGRALREAARAAMDTHGDRVAPDVVFASGLGTIDGDCREASACRSLFRAPVPITAATGALGMTGAASGAFGLVHAFLGLRCGTIAPTTGYERSDPACAVTVVGTTLAHTISRALVWSSDGTRHLAMTIGSVS